MKTLPLALMCTFTGCAPYTAVQMNLIEQARKGIAITQKSLAEKSQIIEQYEKQQRKRLDEAFDADVRENATLTSDWVIEHRRAYSAALDALNNQRQATRDARQTDQRNLQAIDDALNRVLWLESIELRFANIPKVVTP
jgi:hypothetical protein